MTNTSFVIFVRLYYIKEQNLHKSVTIYIARNLDEIYKKFDDTLIDA